jgi:hypothetical protein
MLRAAQDFRQCHALIQRIEPAPSFPPTARPRGHDALAATNVQRGLAAAVQDLSATFRKKQRVYMERESRLPPFSPLRHPAPGPARAFGAPARPADRVRRQGSRATQSRARTCSSRPACPRLGVPAPTRFPPQTRTRRPPCVVSPAPRAPSSLAHLPSLPLLRTQYQTQAQQQQQQQHEPDTHLRARDLELQGIARSIAQLAELFKDLGALVIDQGTLLDSVEYNVEQTAVHVAEAVRELDVATRCVRVFVSSLFLALPSCRSRVASQPPCGLVCLRAVLPCFHRSCFRPVTRGVGCAWSSHTYIPRRSRAAPGSFLACFVVPPRPHAPFTSPVAFLVCSLPFTAPVSFHLYRFIPLHVAPCLWRFDRRCTSGGRSARNACARASRVRDGRSEMKQGSAGQRRDTGRGTARPGGRIAQTVLLPLERACLRNENVWAPPLLCWYGGV